MNDIPERQNAATQLERLAAQRELYTTAKKVFAAQAVIAGPLAVASAFAAMAFPVIRPYTALWGVAASLMEHLWLNTWQNNLKECAARIQEMFDCDVLQLPRNELKVGAQPDPELVKEQALNYAPKAERMPRLMDWYPPIVRELPLECARVVCQRENCAWDAKQRRRYASVVALCVFVVVSAVCAIGVMRGLRFDELLTVVIAPLAPVIVLGIRQYRENAQAASRLEGLKGHALSLWDAALGKHDPTKLLAQSRALQDEIFESRKRSPLVFDWVFRRMRDRYEIQSQHAAEQLVEEARKRCPSAMGIEPGS